MKYVFVFTYFSKFAEHDYAITYFLPYFQHWASYQLEIRVAQRLPLIAPW